MNKLQNTNQTVESSKGISTSLNSFIRDTVDAFLAIEKHAALVTESISALGQDLVFVAQTKDSVLQIIERNTELSQESATSIRQISVSAEGQTTAIQNILESLRELNSLSEDFVKAISRFKIS